MTCNPMVRNYFYNVSCDKKINKISLYIKILVVDKSQKQDCVVVVMEKYTTISKERRRRAPTGWLWVSIGGNKKRLAMRTEHANHPVFKSLLSQQQEYCYGSSPKSGDHGPLALPSCTVSGFYNALVKMEYSPSERMCGTCRRPPPSRRLLMISPFNIFAVHQF